MTSIMEMGKNPNYLGSYDLYDISTPRILVTIDAFYEEDVVANGQTQRCAVMRFKEKYKPMIVNPTNKKRLAKLFHTVMVEKLIGKRIYIGIEKVKAFGANHDALRVCLDMPPAESPMKKCEMCGADILPRAGMNSEQMAAYTKAKYGKELCGDCATKAKAEEKG